MKPIDKKIISEIALILECALTELTPSSELRTLTNWDSLAHISTVTMIESEFGVLILEEEFRRLKTISDIIDFVSNHTK